jgi:hypothetical protein
MRRLAVEHGHGLVWERGKSRWRRVGVEASVGWLAVGFAVGCVAVVLSPRQQR